MLLIIFRNFVTFLSFFDWAEEDDANFYLELSFLIMYTKKRGGGEIF